MFLFLFFSIELILKLLKVEYPIFQKHDEITGFSLLPNTKGIWNREGYGLVEINSKGLRDIEHKLKKNKDTFRIAILGDSFAEARSLNIEDTFWFKLQPNLNGCRINNFKSIETINFGVTEFSTTQQYLTLKHKVWEYDPDLILLAFYSGNDIQDNSKKLAIKKYRPFFNLDENKVVLDQSFKETKPYILLESYFGRIFLQISKYSRISQLLRELYVRAYFKNISKKIDNEKNENISLFNEYSFDQDDWKEAWDITERILLMINNEIKNNKTDFYIVTLSTPIQVHPNQEVRNMFKKKFNVTDIDYADNRIRSFSQKNEIKVINIAKIMREYAVNNNVFFHGFSNTQLGTGHWNKEGHNFASNLISQTLCKDIFNN